MNTGIVHTKQKVNLRGTTDQMPKMEQLHQKTSQTTQFIGQSLLFEHELKHAGFVQDVDMPYQFATLVVRLAQPRSHYDCEISLGFL
jgi:hypothetical protein